MKIPWTTKSDLRKDIALLEAQLERTNKVNTAVSLLKAGEEPDRSFLIMLQSDIWPLVAQTLYVWFKENKGVNYIEQVVTMEDKRKSSVTFKALNDERMPERFTITMQRLAGKTPAQVASEAKAETDSLRNRISAILSHYSSDEPCQDCGQATMCRFHSLLSMLQGRTDP